MAKRERSGQERYHDRVAGIYEGIYESSAYWELYFTLTWRHMRRFLPRCNARASSRPRILDVGCGTGRWGLKLIEAGYQVDFLDISQKMLDQVSLRLDRQPPDYEVRLIHADLADLSLIDVPPYDAILGQGDPLSHCADPDNAMREMTRLLMPGGIMIQSVDNRCGAIDHFAEKGDLQALVSFLDTGVTEWLSHEEEERFLLHTFTPEGLRSLFTKHGYETLSVIGKTILPLRACEKSGSPLLQHRDDIIRIEESLHTQEAMLGRASHLEIAARKPGP